MKKYKRYVSKILNETQKEIFNSPVLNLSKKIMNVPYYTIEIRILDFEPNFDHNRPTPNFMTKLRRAIREAVEVFKNKIKIG